MQYMKHCAELIRKAWKSEFTLTRVWLTNFFLPPSGGKNASTSMHNAILPHATCHEVGSSAAGCVS